LNWHTPPPQGSVLPYNTLISNQPMITATELLDFLCKAQKLSILDITFRQTDEGYTITLRDDWYDDNKWYNKTVFFDNEGQSNWDTGGDYDFHTLNNILDEKLEEQKQKEIKEQKRQELIARLTDEEKELLNLK
jgi:hypothetical protein